MSIDNKFIDHEVYKLIREINEINKIIDIPKKSPFAEEVKQRVVSHYGINHAIVRESIEAYQIDIIER